LSFDVFTKDLSNEGNDEFRSLFIYADENIPLFFLARPLLAFKRDLSRPTSETRAHNEQETLSPPRTRQESSSSSSPLEIIDIDSSGSFKSIFDKVKNTLSPSTKRRTSENPHNDEIKSSSKENHTSSFNASTNKKSRKQQLQPNKSVSFADNIEHDYDSDSINQYSIDDQNEIVRNAHTLADQILNASIDKAISKTINKDDDDDDFQRDFHLTIKPRRISSDNKEDLVYQDLSAEIVAYVLKHALRTLKKEQEQLLLANTNEQNEDIIDLK
jgi:hypothetical protein